MSNLIAFAVQNEQPFLNALINLAVALAAVLMFVHLLLVVLENFWPGLKKEDGWVQATIAWLDRWTHGSGAWNTPVAAKPINAPSSSPDTKAPYSHGFVDWKMLLGILCLGIVAACATASWSNPAFYAGPAVAPIEEVTLKSSQAASAAGFQATVGLGQFPFEGKEWDALDLSALALGGIVAPQTGLSGVLQIGAEVGTLNGILGLGILTTPYTANNQGFLQGGGPGLAFAAMFNISAIVTYFGPSISSGELKTVVRLPRGGL